MKKSIMAGVSIALGCILYLSISDKILGALLFSLGLMNVRLMGLELFTGKIQYLAIEPKIKIIELLKIFLGNVYGAIIAAILVYLCAPNVKTAASAIASARQTIPYLQLLFGGICCGGLMTLATRKDAPLWLSCGCVLAFILAGCFHSIADTFYLCFTPVSCISLKTLLVYFTVIVGNLIGGLALTIH